MLSSLSRAIPCATILIVLGCGKVTSAPAVPDAAIHVDFDAARLVDAQLPDAGPPFQGIGQLCSAQSDCAPGICLQDDTIFPRGYCSLDCAADSSVCPTGTACTSFGEAGSYCLVTCDSASSESTCPTGNGCTSAVLGFIPAGLCVNGCSDASDCGPGQQCNASDAMAVAGQCFTPSAPPGTACRTTDDCSMGSICFTESQYGSPGGECVTLGCDADSNTGCEGDAQCLANGDSGLCYDGCTADSDCRTGYVCGAPDDFHPDRKACVNKCTADTQCSDGRVCNVGNGTCAAPFTPTNLGATCSPFRDDCPGGYCFREFDSGFPGNYCGYLGCTVGDDSTCPSGGACFQTPGGSLVCGKACADSSECRVGYQCLDVDFDGPATSRACIPACTADEECRTDRGFTCNTGTGRCTVAFTGTVGAACNSATCEGGRCLTPASGFPGGYCTLAGCRLGGEGPAEVCPSGSACADDGYGDPNLGWCLETCTTGESPSGCTRAGYICDAPAEATSGLCRPANRR
jgi:hypothetical protein